MRDVAVYIGVTIALIAPTISAFAQRNESPTLREALSNLQPAPTIELDETVRQEIEALDDPSWQRREEATERLKHLDYDDAAIFLQLEASGQSDEQINRLLKVLTYRLFNRPRGAVGIQMDRNTGSDVVVEAILPGFPAEKTLRVGDHILAVNNVAVRSSDHFGDLVKASPPGASVQITFVRADRDEQDNLQRDPGTGRVVYTQPPRTETLVLGDLMDLDDRTIDLYYEEQERTILSAVNRYAPSYPHLWKPLPPDNEQTSLSGDVDDYPVIRQLRNQIERINRGELAVTRSLRRDWERTFTELTELLIDPALSADERTFVMRVMQRYRELIPRR